MCWKRVWLLFLCFGLLVDDGACILLFTQGYILGRIVGGIKGVMNTGARLGSPALLGRYVIRKAASLNMMRRGVLIGMIGKPFLEAGIMKKTLEAQAALMMIRRRPLSYLLSPFSRRGSDKNDVKYVHTAEDVAKNVDSVATYFKDNLSGAASSLLPLRTALKLPSLQIQAGPIRANIELTASSGGSGASSSYYDTSNSNSNLKYNVKSVPKPVSLNYYAAPTPKPVSSNYYAAPTPKPVSLNYYVAPTPKPVSLNYYVAPTPKPVSLNYYVAPTPKPVSLNYYVAPTPKQVSSNYHLAPTQRPSSSNYYDPPTPSPVSSKYYLDSTLRPPISNYNVNSGSSPSLNYFVTPPSPIPPYRQNVNHYYYETTTQQVPIASAPVFAGIEIRF